MTTFDNAPPPDGWVPTAREFLRPWDRPDLTIPDSIVLGEN